MPVYQRGKNRWRVVVYHRNAPRGCLERIAHGRKKDARDYEARLRAELEASGPVAVRVAPTFSDFSTSRYKAHAQLHLRASTWSNRKYDVATLAEHFGKLRLTDITTDRVEVFKAKRRREGMKPRTINNELMALRAVLSFAREMHVPCADPRIRKLPVRRGRHAEAWSAGELAKLFKACQQLEPQIMPLLVFLANTGCRKGEAIALRWEHVDLERGLVRIWPYDDDLGDFDTKSGKAREVPIGSALRPWLEAGSGSDVWVFPAPRSLRRKKAPPKPRRYAQFPKRQFARIVGKAGLEGGPHKLRHTFASHFLAAVPDLYLLATILGHSYSRVTELYGHLLPDHLERARDAVSLAPAVGPASVAASQRWGVAAGEAGSVQNHGDDHGGG